METQTPNQTKANPPIPLRKELSYDDKVIKKIAGLATNNVSGVLAVSGGMIGGLSDRLRAGDTTKGIDADVGKRQVALDLTVVCEYGQFIPELFDKVADTVGRAIRNMTGLELVEINMHVQDVLPRDEFAEMREKQMNPHSSPEEPPRVA